jgi:hypothetical protein
MDALATPEILRVLQSVPDPHEHNTRHKLFDILAIALAVDGKSIRRSFQNAWDKAAWRISSRKLCLAQVKTDGKGQELDAIEKLLAMVNVKGAVVSIDAVATNMRMAQAITNAGAG